MTNKFYWIYVSIAYCIFFPSYFIISASASDTSTLASLSSFSPSNKDVNSLTIGSDLGVTLVSNNKSSATIFLA